MTARQAGRRLIAEPPISGTPLTGVLLRHGYPDNLGPMKARRRALWQRFNYGRHLPPLLDQDISCRHLLRHGAPTHYCEAAGSGGICQQAYYYTTGLG